MKLVKPNITDDEFIAYDVSVARSNNKYTVSFGPHKNVIFGFPEVKIKYELGEYGNCVFSHKSPLMRIISDRIKEKIPSLKELVYDEISFKVPSKLKNEVSKAKRGDTVKVAVKFNDCWEYGDKAYISFVCVKFEIIQKTTVEDTTVDDDEEGIDF